MAERRLSLRARLAGTMAALLLGGSLLLYLAARVYAQTAADRSYDRVLAGSALSIAETLSVTGRDVQVDLPYAALDMLSSAPEDRVFYRVFGPGERTATGYADLPAPRDDARLLADADSGASHFFDAAYRGELVRFAMLGRKISEIDASGWVWVQVGQTRRAREALARELVLGSLLPIALLLSLALVLVWSGIGRALRPLARVGADISTREPADLHPVTVPVPAEILPLVDGINNFMQRLSGNIGTLRAFIANAAHQMRTPLAALRAQAQLALDEEPSELRHSLRAIERNATRLSRLLDQLLSDATVIHRAELRRFERFDLLATVRQAMHEAVPRADGCEARLETPLAAAPMTGDEVMLREAIKNLIDNALRHGGAAASGLALALYEAAGAYRVEVADRGPGIPAADRERVFERFVRGDSGASGAGLGLAIVRQVVGSHRGEVRLRDRVGGGLVVELVLPAERA